MGKPLDDEALDILFRKARTHNAFFDRPVSDDVLRELYDLMKWGPTSSNTCPARILFLRTPEAKQRLAPALYPGNVEKTMKAPVTAVVGYDLTFYEKLPQLAPHNPNAKSWFTGSEELAQVTAFRNGSLQGGYFILAARADALPPDRRIPGCKGNSTSPCRASPPPDSRRSHPPRRTPHPPSCY